MKPVLDREKLDGLRALIGEAKCEAAIARFKDELHDCLSAIATEDPESAEYAHRLAGVAGLLGFDDLEEHSRRFLAAANQDTDDVASCAKALMDAARRAEAAVA